jgi:hypothetical protein
MAIDFNIQNKEENSSFALLRTNPKLTSNLKLTVDSKEHIFLSSFKANRILSKVEHQKFEVSDTGVYANDVARFFKKVPKDDRFQTLRTQSDTTPYSEFSNQYENQYNYGASFNSTKLYDEQYKLFAPIWLDRKIPGKFVVYRVLNTDYNIEYNEDTLGQNSRILELLKYSTIVKTFDLTTKSKLGKYLNSHVFDKGMPASSIEFNFSEGGDIAYRGIDTNNGGFVSKRDSIAEDYIRQDSLEIEANEMLTSGFERHGVISANLINMEFMFDDEFAENYEIYRYFGLYVDVIEEGTFDVDSVSADNIVSIRPGSIQTTYPIEGTGLTHEDMLPSKSDLEFPMLSYINLGDNQFLHINNNTPISGLNIPVSNYNNIAESISSTDFSVDSNKIQALPLKISNKPFIKFEITKKPISNDRFYIADKTEIELSNYNLHDFTGIADDSISPGTFFGNKFSSAGSLNQIAIAVSRLIESMTTYKTTTDGLSVIVEDYAVGSNRKRMSFGICELNVSSFITVVIGSVNDVGLIDSDLQNNVPVIYFGTRFSDWDMYTARGGSKVGSAFLVSDEELGEVKVGQYVKHINLSKYSKIIDVVSDYINKGTHRVVIESVYQTASDGTIQLYNKFKPTFGKFSAYDLMDFDFDFHSTKNSEIGELEYDKLSEGEYAGLSPVLYQEDVDDLIISTPVNSEYDRLDENKLKETALKSRIVPSILKYALKNGTNARNLPYILNTNESFGANNLSPEIRIESGRNVDDLNMEHFHFNKITDKLYQDNKTTNLKSFTSYTTTDGISIPQLKSTSVDYFSLYFNWKGSINANTKIWVDDKFNKLYTKFNGGSTELEPNTVFRGLRYIYKKRKEFKQDSPVSFINTTETNSYKFGVTLNYNKGNPNGVEYTVIKNDEFKFICVIIDVNVQDNDIESLSRSLMYESFDIKLNNDIVDSVIPFSIDLNRAEWGEERIKETVIYANDTGEEASFNDSVTLDAEGKYSWIYFEIPGSGIEPQYAGMRVVSVIDNNSIVVAGRPIPFSIGTEGPSGSGVPYITDAVLNTIPIDAVFYYWKTGSAGWKNILEEVVSYNFAKRFNNFGDINYITVDSSGESLNRFILEVQDGVDVVKPSVIDTASDGNRPKSYQSSSNEIGRVLKERKDGGYFTILKRMNGEYNPLFKDVISFTDMYSEQSAIIPEVPIQGSEGPYVGTIPFYPENSFGSGSGSGAGVGFEYNGAFNALILNKDRNNLIYNKFRNLGIAFASYKNVDENYGFINNYYYHKVNDENSKNLLKLSDTTDKLPLYPMINEIAIDKKNLNVFKSKYSSDYFTKSIAGGSSEEVHGTLSPVESNSFMVSTIMKVKNQYDLTSFSNTIETSIDSLDYIRSNKLNKTAIHWVENDAGIIADFYLPKTIYEELIEDGISSKFRKYISAENSFGDKSTIDDDLEKYVYSNIVNRFIIENTEIYGIEGKNISTEFISIDSPDKLKEGRFTQLTNFDIQGYQNESLSFRLIYNKKPGFKYHLKLHIKIQA